MEVSDGRKLGFDVAQRKRQSQVVADLALCQRDHDAKVSTTKVRRRSHRQLRQSYP